MNVHEKAVQWFRDNLTIEGMPEELEFMRKKAETVHDCLVCKEYQQPFWHILAAAVCNGKNLHLEEKIPVDNNDFYINSTLYSHLVYLVEKWSKELELHRLMNERSESVPR